MYAAELGGYLQHTENISHKIYQRVLPVSIKVVLKRENLFFFQFSQPSNKQHYLTNTFQIASLNIQMHSISVALSLLSRIFFHNVEEWTTRVDQLQ